MIRVLILALIGYLTYRVAKRWVGARIRSGRVAGSAPGRIDDVMVKDPQCGTYFARQDGVALRHAGRDILFCSPACRDQYLAANPPPEA